ncbi:MAG: amidohydrolase 2 [Caulobacter sp.]|nr:amidohydrolase 2 [Caulobacter sp.]
MEDVLTNRRQVMFGAALASAAGAAAVAARADAQAAVEPALFPDQPIIDPHHHLHDRTETDLSKISHSGSAPSYFHYLYEEFREDLNCGHNIKSTVFVECEAMYRADGPAPLRPVGEVEFVNGVSAMAASGRYGPVRVAAGIVGFADLTLGAAVDSVLVAQMAASSRYRGIRYGTTWDADSSIIRGYRRPPKGLLADARFREGFARLGANDLSFDAWVYHPQLPEVADLAGAFPGTRIILNHTGGPLNVGVYAGSAKENFTAWRRGMAAVAAHGNVAVKIGGMGMAFTGIDYGPSAATQTSELLAEKWRPHVETCIELFGADRCMFESNFPVDKRTYGYGAMWNGFKRLTARCSADERQALFFGSAAKAYKLNLGEK